MIEYARTKLAAMLPARIRDPLAREGDESPGAPVRQWIESPDR